MPAYVAQTRRSVLPFRANPEDSALVPARSDDPLLPPVDNGWDFNQPHEDAAKAAGTRVAKPGGNVRNPLVGFYKKMAGRIEADLRYDFTVTSAHLSKMTLQRARTYPQ